MTGKRSLEKEREESPWELQRLRGDTLPFRDLSGLYIIKIVSFEVLRDLKNILRMNSNQKEKKKFFDEKKFFFQNFDTLSRHPKGCKMLEMRAKSLNTVLCKACTSWRMHLSDLWVCGIDRARLDYFETKKIWPTALLMISCRIASIYLRMSTLKFGFTFLAVSTASSP